jgi:uncharacterized protein (TIGR02594 family)
MALDKTDNSGMTKEEVTQVQTRLKDLGFDPGPIDGVMGDRTSSAIIAFKRSKGLNPRPYVGGETWKLLMQPELFTASAEELPWIAEAKRVLKLHEVYDNVQLRKWLGSDGFALGDPSKLPWCGDFVETSIRLSLRDEAIPANPYWALNWRNFGVATKATYGAIASVSRKGGGHVCFIVGEDSSRYFCLGGNQANRVSVAPMDKGRFDPESFRWPKTFAQRPIHLPKMTSAEASNYAEG